MPLPLIVVGAFGALAKVGVTKTAIVATAGIAGTAFVTKAGEKAGETLVDAGVSATAWAANAAYEGYYDTVNLQEDLKALKQACDHAHLRRSCKVNKVNNANGVMYRFILEDNEWMDAITVWIKDQQVFVREGMVGFTEVFPGELLNLLIEKDLVPNLLSRRASGRVLN